ncbi:MAG: 3-oxoacyl-ACP synthase [Myxococcales bacterium]|nr:3-oxoacyl-ACP synthase [Myxococcales bacterium]
MGAMTIIGTGSYAPGVPIPNAALARVMDTNDAWIRQRTGIEQRHFARDGETVSELGAHAARRALRSAGITAAEVDYIVFGTMTPEYAFPGPGGLLGAKLGIEGVPALDLRQQCASAPFGLQVANGLLASDAARTVLFVCAEAHAGFMPWRDWDVVRGESTREVAEEDYARATRHRGVAILFGDGASAMVLRHTTRDGAGFLGAECHSDGARADLMYMPGGGFTRLPFFSLDVIEFELCYPQMRGPELFKSAVTELAGVVRSLCARHHVALDEIDCVVAHQANDRINSAVRKALGLPPEKVPSNIARYGNTSSATVGILLDELRADGRVKEGDLICVVALGAGLHWGAALLRL